MFFSSGTTVGGYTLPLTIRGNVAADFTEGDLIADGTNYDMDISAIVGANRALALFRVILRSNGGGQHLLIAEKGSGGSGFLADCYTNQNAVTVGYDVWVVTDASGVLLYQLSTAVWSIIKVTVAAWVVL